MLPRRLRPVALALPLALAALAAAPAAADAFCGFYVAGADAKLFNNATIVVLMRDGTRTVLSMQNNYQGPPQDFAMVVPVPVVLQKENVKTLPDVVFDRVDKLAAPRLVEYWEQDPCSPRLRYDTLEGAGPVPSAMASAAPKGGVKIEAQFEVGEYEVVVLSASDSLGLDTWLRENRYRIPEGAEPILRPYVQAGMKFFVAKVNTGKVRFEKGMAMLSPLRFHYDSDTFNLPVRLGLLNSSGKQDLIVHILARGQRYEMANYKNVTIPTNIDLEDKAKEGFGAFYAALFDRTLEENPGAIVTEYAWDASTCDPCPSPALSDEELATLGADALPGGTSYTGGYVLTRLHARYGKESLGEDLVFRAAGPISGGREVRGLDGKLETGSASESYNNFQGRYAIRHPWTGPMACDAPVRGVWGGPPGGEERVEAAQNLAFAPRGGVQLASLVRHDVPEIKLKAAAAAVPHPGSVPQPVTPPSAAPVGQGPGAPAPQAGEPGGCGACRIGGGAADPRTAPRGAMALVAVAAALTARRRRTR